MQANTAENHHFATTDFVHKTLILHCHLLKSQWFC